MAGDILASYADVAIPSAANWTDGPAQDDAADLAARWGSQYPAYDGALTGTDAAASTTGMAGDARGCQI